MKGLTIPKQEKKEETTSGMSDLNKMLVEQVSHELLNATKYRHLAFECSRLGFHKIEKFFIKQSNDEIAHSDMIMDFLKDRNYKFTGYNLSCGNITVSNPRDMMLMALETERGTTKLLTDIQMYASSLKTSEGRLVYEFISPMVAEQTEEEKILLDFLATLEGLTTKADMVLFEHSYFE